MNASLQFNNATVSPASDGTLATPKQIRVSEAKTLNCNPVDIAYEGGTGTVNIAEAANVGGAFEFFKFWRCW